MDPTLFDKIRESTKFVQDNADDVKVNKGEIDNFLSKLDLDQFKNLGQPLKFPLKFESTEEEVSFWALLHMINFASGWRKLLHKFCGQGAWDTMCKGMISIHLTGKKLNASFLCQLSLSDIQSYFGIPLTMDKEVQPGLTQSFASDIRPLAEMILKVLQDAGHNLVNRRIDTIAEFILSAIAKDKEPHAARVISELIQMFPAFNDKAMYKGKEIFLYKKVQLLCVDLHRRFAKEDARFNFVDIHKLTVFTDNVVPAVLRKLGMIELSEGLAKKIDSAATLKPGDQEIEMRAIAIQVCDSIIEKAREKYPGEEFKEIFNSIHLDYYLWTLGKEPEFRKFERHYTKDTIFY